MYAVTIETNGGSKFNLKLEEGNLKDVIANLDDAGGRISIPDQNGLDVVVIPIPSISWIGYREDR